MVLSIVSLLVVIFLSILITRVAAIALTHTGLARESAKFQARSAFTEAGFTTSESEMVVNHPVRRRIVLMLMLLGNAGIVAAMSSLDTHFRAVFRGLGGEPPMTRLNRTSRLRSGSSAEAFELRQPQGGAATYGSFPGFLTSPVSCSRPACPAIEAVAKISLKRYDRVYKGSCPAQPRSSRLQGNGSSPLPGLVCIRCGELLPGPA